MHGRCWAGVALCARAKFHFGWLGFSSSDGVRKAEDPPRTPLHCSPDVSKALPRRVHVALLLLDVSAMSCIVTTSSTLVHVPPYSRKMRFSCLLLAKILSFSPITRDWCASLAFSITNSSGMARARSAGAAPAAASAASEASVASQATAEPRRTSARRKRSRAAAQEAEEELEESADERDAEELVARVHRSASRRGSRRGKTAGAILAEFTSLDALLDYDREAQRKKQQHAHKLQKLRADADAADRGDGDNDGSGDGSGDGSALGRLVHDMETNMTSLAADSDLFAVADLGVNEEKFGYVFTPITEVGRRARLTTGRGFFADLACG
jgi:hypothetical protein